ncbi:hypothetical protein CsSME_00046424 [Camellia sinensis var. sinensis]
MRHFKGRFPLIIGLDADLMIPASNINLRKTLLIQQGNPTYHLILELEVLDCNLVDCTAIHTHMPRAILLGCQKHWNITRAKARPDIPFCQKLFYLPLQLFFLLWRHAIGRVVWKRRLGNQINTMLNVTHRRQIGRKLLGKDIEIFFQKSGHLNFFFRSTRVYNRNQHQYNPKIPAFFHKLLERKQRSGTRR